MGENYEINHVVMSYKILVNASNLKKGGGLQVADSVCGCLERFREHEFVVVVSRYLEGMAVRIKGYPNVKVVRYDLPKTVGRVLTGRDKFLDGLVEEEGIDAVLTIFGPSLWRPRVLHVSGFARAQCLLLDSPYYKRMRGRDLIKAYVQQRIWLWAFKRCADIYFTENEFISERLRKVFRGKRVYTVTNYYNQVFDEEGRWGRNVVLSPFVGTTLLTISANYPHKNLLIIVPTIHYLHEHYPDFHFRFVLTITKEQLGIEDNEAEKDIVFLGGVPITECPNLYEQCDVVFQPSLLECFSAVYPEAMRMQKPIITTDLGFAHSLCGEAALYYDALSPESFGEAIYRLAHDNKLRSKLIKAGETQLKSYDNYDERAKKLIGIVECEYKKRLGM